MKIKSIHGFLLTLFLFTTVLFAQEFSKKEIVVGTKVAEPFVIKEGAQWSGIAFDLWKEISKDLNISYDIEEYDLEGLINAVIEGKIDLAVSPMTITEERERAIDFSHPFFITGLGIAVPVKEEGGLFKILERISSTEFLEVVGILLLLLFAAGFFTWLFERKKNKEQFGDGATKGVGSGLWWAAVTMTTVGYGDKAPLTTGGRIIAFIWMFASIIIISSFTAAITTSLTVTQLDTKIKNVNDLYDIRVGTVVSSSSESYLIEKRINYLHYETPPQAIKALAEGEIDAVVYDAPILKYLINENNYSNLLRVLPYNLKPQFYGFSMPFNSELREPINRAILKVINQPGWQKVLYTYLGE